MVLGRQWFLLAHARNPNLLLSHTYDNIAYSMYMIIMKNLEALGLASRKKKMNSRRSADHFDIPR